MRATIETHNQAVIERIMQTLGTTNPSVAVNYIINYYQLGQSGGLPVPQPLTIPPPTAQPIDDFAGIEDWA
jgi:hypothetical protein